MRPEVDAERSDAACDVVVLGGGSAGIAAAASAAREGARTLLIDAGPQLGGELVSGIPLLGCFSHRREWVVGGVVRELLAGCEAMDGYIGPVSDFRTLNVVAFDPEVMKLAVVQLLASAGAMFLLYSFVEGVEAEAGIVKAVWVRNKQGRTRIAAPVFVDASGDGDLAVAAGAPWEAGGEGGSFQALTMVFRMVGVDTPALLDFIAANPESFGLADQPAMGLTRTQCIEALVAQGQPKAAVLASGPLLREAIAAGEIYPLSALAIAPVSTPRREVSINATRVADVDATQADRLSETLPRLFEQVRTCEAFLRRRVPGFESAHFSALAPRIGIRETRRVMGEYVLDAGHVLEGRSHPQGIARGAHEIDIHGAGTKHVRRTIPGGGHYDLPFGCLVPRGLKNVLVAGRCLSSTREGQSSARVMGTCMAMGQAAGTAAARFAVDGLRDVRAISVDALRARLRERGALV